MTINKTAMPTSLVIGMVVMMMAFSARAVSAFGGGGGGGGGYVSMTPKMDTSNQPQLKGYISNKGPETANGKPIQQCSTPSKTTSKKNDSGDIHVPPVTQQLIYGGGGGCGGLLGPPCKSPGLTGGVTSSGSGGSYSGPSSGQNGSGGGPDIGTLIGGIAKAIDSWGLPAAGAGELDPSQNPGPKDLNDLRQNWGPTNPQDKGFVADGWVPGQTMVKGHIGDQHMAIPIGDFSPKNIGGPSGPAANGGVPGTKPGGYSPPQSGITDTASGPNSTPTGPQNASIILTGIRGALDAASPQPGAPGWWKGKSFAEVRTTLTKILNDILNQINNTNTTGWSDQDKTNLSILKIHTEGRIKDIPNQVKGWEQALQGIEINKQKTLQNQPQQYQGGGPTMVPTNTPAGKQGGIDMYGNPY